MITQDGISATLLRLGIVQNNRVKVFSPDTRDQKKLRVYRDETSKVIFIDDHYVGDQVYQSGSFRSEPKPLMSEAGRDFEDHADTLRRIENYKQFVIGKDICDFGCGTGSFLRDAKPLARKVAGVELNEKYSHDLNADGINCQDDIDKIPFELDTVFLFHSFEHLPAPLFFLEKIKNKLKANGKGRIVIEVPHAKDFLIQNLDLQSFIDFTLWSQHLILHTRESLTAFLQETGYKSITIEGVQRYGISNHLHWLQNSKPGGHKTNLSILETGALKSSYADALAKLDANDTLVAVAHT
jgi:SAM-dependent methyltransferase